jgi:hypothetical protein
MLEPKQANNLAPLQTDMGLTSIPSGRVPKIFGQIPSRLEV